MACGVGDELDVGHLSAGYTITVVVRKPQARRSEMRLWSERVPLENSQWSQSGAAEMVNDDRVPELVEVYQGEQSLFRETLPVQSS